MTKLTKLLKLTLYVTRGFIFFIFNEKTTILGGKYSKMNKW